MSESNDRLDRMERLLESTIQVTQSNARSNQALSYAIADTNRQVAEHVARTTAAIEELSRIVGTMARIFNDHINDNQRHNQP